MIPVSDSRTSTGRNIAPGFTIVELLIVVSIIALLISILLPAIGKAREHAQLLGSQSNLRQLGAAHAAYGAEYNDNQWSPIPHDIASYGSDVSSAYVNYFASFDYGENRNPLGNPNTGIPPTGIRFDLGFYDGSMWFWGTNPDGYGQPIWPEEPKIGWFRFNNVLSFNQYVTGRVYDPVFYAPQDRVVKNAIGECWDYPGGFCLGYGPPYFVYHPSYILSPAALYDPRVFNAPEGEFPNVWHMAGSHRVPTFSQARYASLKTHLLEHHWLQNSPAECNAAWPSDFGTYDGCEPFYFNHGWDSTPATLFYDGHVSLTSVRDAVAADGRAMSQSGGQNGLWRRDSFLGSDGYYMGQAWDPGGNLALDPPETSYHILTNGGILGRDTMSQ